VAVGEYISVSAQRDSEQALLAKERHELKHDPESEFAELISLYEKKGLTREVAITVAHELTKHDAFLAHVDAELYIDPNNLTNPWSAAFASAASFSVGAMIPLVAIILPSENVRILVTFIVVFVALVVTGSLSAYAYAGGSNKTRAKQYGSFLREHSQW